MLFNPGYQKIRMTNTLALAAYPRKRYAPNWACHVMLMAILLFSTLPVRAQATSDSIAPIVIGFDDNSNTYGVSLAKRIYDEAFKRLGIPWKPGYYPLERKTLLEDEGKIDGDGGRVYGFGAAHPNLVRVEEPIIHFGFALYAANPDLKLKDVDELESVPLRVDYRLGIFLCENILKKRVAADRLSIVSNERQGLHKLLAGRSDLYCDLDTVILQTSHSDEFKDAKKVRKVLNIGTFPTYPYLHKKHADLVPRLTAVLKQMKAEGLMDTYRIQVEQTLGWSQ
jgi:polar amino acid transport system substrate-binding protein